MSTSSQLDFTLETLHTLGVRLGVLDPSVAVDGPQLLTAMSAYSDHLAENAEALDAPRRVAVLEIQNARLKEERDALREVTVAAIGEDLTAAILREPGGFGKELAQNA